MLEEERKSQREIEVTSKAIESNDVGNRHPLFITANGDACVKMQKRTIERSIPCNCRQKWNHHSITQIWRMPKPKS